MSTRCVPPSSRHETDERARFHACFDNLLDPLGIYRAVRDDEGRIVDFLVEYVNAAASATIGIPRERHVGRRLGEVLPAVRRSGLFDAYRRVVETGEPLRRELAYEDTLEDGRPLSLVVDVRAVRFDDGFVLSWRDVTQRKRIEERLSQTESRFGIVVESLADHAIYMVDAAGLVASWNLGAERIKGWRDVEILGQPVAVFYPPEAVAAGAPEHELAVAAAQEQHTVEGWRMRKDGSRYWASATTTALRDARGTLLGFAKVVRDLSERKRADEERQRLWNALGEKERLLEAVLRQLPSGVVVRGADGRVLTWNDQATRIVGSPAAAWDQLPLHRTDGSPLRPHELATARALRGEGVRAEEQLVEHGDGRRYVIEVNAGPVRDEKGAITAGVVVFTDVTERNRADAALRESEMRLRSLLDNSFEFIGLLDEEGVVVEANRAALAFAGASRAEVVGRRFRDTPWWTHAPEATAQIDRAVDEARRGRFVRFETTHRAPDGRLVHVDFSLTPVRDAGGRVVLLVPEGRDVTERKRHEWQRDFVAEAARILAGSLERTTILDALAHQLVPALGDACVITVGESGGELAPAAVAHADPSREPALREQAARVVVAHHRRCVAATRGDGECACLEPNGQAIAVLDGDGDHLGRATGARASLCVPLRACGAIVGAMSLLRFDDRRYDRDDLALAEDLAGRTAVAVENIRLYDEARRATRARDDLIAAVSHDLRNPLNAIVLDAALLGRRAPSGTREAVSSRRIERAAATMNRLIEDLLELARVESGHLALAPDECDVASLLDEAVELLAPLAADRALRLEARVGPGATRVVCERARVLRVLSNLVGNAIKFSGAGEVVALRADAGDGVVRFAVEDHGPGIAADAVDRIFDRFWQAQVGMGGVGLGLSIAKAIVEAHRGRIWVESRPGEGSTFVFTLPGPA